MIQHKQVITKKPLPKAQLVVIGPPGDGFGEYAAAKLQQLAAREE